MMSRKRIKISMQTIAFRFCMLSSLYVCCAEFYGLLIRNSLMAYPSDSSLSRTEHWGSKPSQEKLSQQAVD